MAIDHDAPKDLGWAQDAILDLDTRLESVENDLGAPPPEHADMLATLDSLTERVTALENKGALQSPVTPQAADDSAQGQT